MKQDNQCPNCGQFKYVSTRLYFMLIGFAVAGCGLWFLIIPPIGLGVILFGILSFIGGIFANGKFCTNCKYNSKSVTS